MVIQNDSHTGGTVRITRKTGTCDDGTCPAIWDTDDPRLVAVQGPVLTDPEALADIGRVPAPEGIVLIPRELLAKYRTEQP
jgi:hypothetical protein